MDTSLKLKARDNKMTITLKAPNDKYRDEYDRIFRKDDDGKESDNANLNTQSEKVVSHE